jgi:DNA repair protein RadC
MEAVQFIIAHNHPGGDNSPSEADRAVTRAVAAGGRAIGIPLRDHIIVAPPDRWTSLFAQDSGLFR